MGFGQQIINGTYDMNKTPSLTAFEELKAWCEKHLNKEDYKIVPESRSFCATIYFAEFPDTGLGMVCFAPDGSVAGLGAIDEDDMIEHIEDCERIEEEPKSDPHTNPYWRTDDTQNDRSI